MAGIMGNWGGSARRITKEQRDRIVEVYEEQGREAATELAMSHGLSEAYALKLAQARGVVPRLRKGTHPRFESGVQA